MEKWLVIVIVVGLTIGCALFWGLLVDVEENGAVYGILEVLNIPFIIFSAAFTLFLMWVWWDYIPQKIEKKLGRLIKNKVVSNVLFILYFAVSIYFTFLYYKIGSWIGGKYDDFMYKKQFEHKYKDHASSHEGRGAAPWGRHAPLSPPCAFFIYNSRDNNRESSASV